MTRSIARFYAESSDKVRPGPGGIKCPCCNPFHCHPRKSKPLSHRLVRRVRKHRLIKEVAAAIVEAKPDWEQ